MAPPPGKGRRKPTGHENDEGGQLFAQLLTSFGCSPAVVANVQHAWAAETFRKYRRALTHFSLYMRRAGVPRETLQDPQRSMACVASFLCDPTTVAQIPAKSLKPMGGQLRQVLLLMNPLSDKNILAQTNRALRRQDPSPHHFRTSIFDLDTLLQFVEQTYPDAAALSDYLLMSKTMLLVMVFTACRLVELARMEVPQASDLSPKEVQLHTVTKQRGTIRQAMVVHAVSPPALCPVVTLRAWLQRREAHPSPRLFYRCPAEGATAMSASRASAHTRNAAGPAEVGDALSVPPLVISLSHLTAASIEPVPHAGGHLTSRDVGIALKALMRAAGIPDRYGPYSIKHAVVTKLFARGASDEQVAGFGHWAPGSRVPRLFYNITGADGQWIGTKLIADRPALQTEAALQRGLGQAEEEEVESSSSSSRNS